MRYYTIAHILVSAAIAVLPLRSEAADLPVFKSSAVAEKPYCRSLFPAPFTLWWPCDPTAPVGGNDRSQAHTPINLGLTTTKAPPSDPGDGCGNKGDSKGHGSKHGDRGSRGEHSGHDGSKGGHGKGRR